MRNNKFYVVMTDKFMSGWGMAAGKSNKLVIVCDTLEDAEIVYQNAKRRSEMKHVNIRCSKPYYGNRYHVSLHDKTDYSAWFAPGRS